MSTSNTLPLLKFPQARENTFPEWIMWMLLKSSIPPKKKKIEIEKHCPEEGYGLNFLVLHLKDIETDTLDTVLLQGTNMFNFEK